MKDWETYYEELEQWRGDKSRADAWIELGTPLNELNNEDYKELYRQLTMTGQKEKAKRKL